MLLSYDFQTVIFGMFYCILMLLKKNLFLHSRPVSFHLICFGRVVMIFPDF